MPRARLVAALAEHTQVTVLRAPAGFGKTTLLRQWRQSDPAAVHVRVRPDATAPEAVWFSIADALAAAGHAGPATLRCPRAEVERMLASAGPLTLALDGVDSVAAAGFDEVLLDLAREHAGLRLVVAQRGDSWFGDDLLGDVRARVIGAEELVFTRRETADLLGTTLPQLARQSSYWAERVHRSSGGWPEVTAAVVRRMALAAPDHVELAAIATRTAASYLRPRLIPELERAGALDLAMTTAVTGRFTAALADAVLRLGDSAAMLEQLVRRGLLACETVDGERGYRWPDAARDVLVEELDRDPHRVAALHTAWATAFLEHERPRDAVRHAVAARDWSLLVTVVESSWWTLLHDERGETRAALVVAPPAALAGSRRARALREILLTPAGTPPRVLADERHPPFPSLPVLPSGGGELARLATSEHLHEVLDTGLLVTVTHRHRGHHAVALAHARRLLEIAIAAHRSRPAEVAPHLAAIQLEVGIGLLLTGEVAAALPALQRAHRLGTADPREPALSGLGRRRAGRRQIPVHLGRSGQEVATTAAALVVLAHAVLGEIAAARRWRTLRDATPAAYACSSAAVGIAVTAADLLIAVGELDLGAAAVASRRLALLDPTADPWLDLATYALYAQAQDALHRGDVQVTLDGIDRAQLVHEGREGDEVAAESLLLAARADLLIAGGRANHAQQCLRRIADHGPSRVPLARLALLAGDTDQAARIAADQDWERTAGIRDRLEMRLIEAVAAGRAGDPALAERALDRAIRATRESDLRSAWATVSRSALDELGTQEPAIARLLDDPVVAAARGVYPDAVVLVELSAREHEVLELLGTGAVLDQVAAALTISYNTVKTHVRSIYRKLDVDSRQAAIAEARRRGLLRSAVARDRGMPAAEGPGRGQRRESAVS